jgi:hypothetical protein
MTKKEKNPMTPSGIEPATIPARSTVPQPTEPPRNVGCAIYYFFSVGKEVI